MTREPPRLHPQLTDPHASSHCPECGELGVRLRKLGRGFEEWACPQCEPDIILDHEREADPWHG